MEKTQILLPKLLLILGIFILILGSAVFFFNKQQKAAPIPSQTPTISPEVSLLSDIAVWYPSAPWSEPKKVIEGTQYGNLSGESIEAEVISPNPSIPHFEIVPQLNQKGFTLDNDLSADGPGMSMWGYKNEKDGKTKVIIFSYSQENLLRITLMNP